MADCNRSSRVEGQASCPNGLPIWRNAIPDQISSTTQTATRQPGTRRRLERTQPSAKPSTKTRPSRLERVHHHHEGDRATPVDRDPHGASRSAACSAHSTCPKRRDDASSEQAAVAGEGFEPSRTLRGGADDSPQSDAARRVGGRSSWGTPTASSWAPISSMTSSTAAIGAWADVDGPLGEHVAETVELLRARGGDRRPEPVARRPAPPTIQHGPDRSAVAVEAPVEYLPSAESSRRTRSRRSFTRCGSGCA